MARQNKIILALPEGLNEMDVKSTLQGLVKALGLSGHIGMDHFSPRPYDIIMSDDHAPLLLLPSDDIMGSEAVYQREFAKDLVEAKIFIRCSAQSWTNLTKGARR